MIGLFTLLVIVALAAIAHGTQSCGTMEGTSAHIVGGRVVGRLNFPWSVHLYLSNRCNGLLIDEKRILTKAHCLHANLRNRSGVFVHSVFNDDPINITGKCCLKTATGRLASG